MERDLDLIRHLLQTIEQGGSEIDPTKVAFQLVDDSEPFDEDAAEATFSRIGRVTYQLELLQRHGWIEVSFRTLANNWKISGLSWEAHDFVDATRDEAVWERTKQGALKAAGGWTVNLLADLAKAIAKKQIENYTGLQL